jgi:hypothetical protein
MVGVVISRVNPATLATWQSVIPVAVLVLIAI